MDPPLKEQRQICTLEIACQDQALQAKSPSATAVASLDLPLKEQRQICTLEIACQGQALQAKMPPGL